MKKITLGLTVGLCAYSNMAASALMGTTITDDDLKIARKCALHSYEMTNTLPPQVVESGVPAPVSSYEKEWTFDLSEMGHEAKAYSFYGSTGADSVGRGCLKLPLLPFKGYTHQALGAVYRVGKTIIVAFHGSHWGADWKTDVNITPTSVTSYGLSGDTTEGLKLAVDASYDSMVRQLKKALGDSDVIRDGINLIFTGHSLGGGLTAVTAGRLVSQKGNAFFPNILPDAFRGLKLITFSSMRPGTSLLAQELNLKIPNSIRIFNDVFDVVPRVLALSGYHHVGKPAEFFLTDEPGVTNKVITDAVMSVVEFVVKGISLVPLLITALKDKIPGLAIAAHGIPSMENMIKSVHHADMTETSEGVPSVSIFHERRGFFSKPISFIASFFGN
jgi:hypothetical protein